MLLGCVNLSHSCAGDIVNVVELAGVTIVFSWFQSSGVSSHILNFFLINGIGSKLRDMLGFSL